MKSVVADLPNTSKLHQKSASFLSKKPKAFDRRTFLGRKNYPAEPGTVVAKYLSR